MEPPPATRRARLATVPLLAALVLFPLSACGLLQTGVPAAPASSSATVVFTPTPTPSTEPTSPMESPTASGAVSPTVVYPSGWPTYSEPAEAACVVPTGGPTSVAGADGPTLTAKQVATAWKNSEEAESNHFSSGTVSAKDARHAAFSPASVLIEPGVKYAGLSAMEYTGWQTFVFADPGRAAAKLEAVRVAFRQPCSYDYTGGMGGPFVVAHLGEDAANQLVVQGDMQGVSVANYFVRYGNTVTALSATMIVLQSSDVFPLILNTLSKA